MNDQDDQSHGVVVGYDGSPSVRLALEWAAETARQLGTRRTIVHSLSLSMIPGFPAVDESQVEPTLHQAAEVVVGEGADHASRVLEESQIATQYWLGSPAGQLVDASRDADLIVLGSRGHGRLRAGLLGSTSYAVTAHARCPVVIVRAGAEQQEQQEEQEKTAGDLHVARPGPEHPVVVGVDDSEAAQRALDAAAAWAEREHAALHVVHVAHSVSMEAWTYAETTKAGTDRTHAVRDDAERTVTRLGNRARADHPNLEVSTEVLYGDPGQTLAELAAHAGLVVVGSRGRGGFSGMLLGSVSHRVIHDAVCPVLVVR
jgi:nucleotide-binding universal stress UspA family protein